MPAGSAVTPIEAPETFSFLASHGLRSPLSAIRWACGRLRKSATGSLNPEQKGLIEEIHANAKVLTTVLGSMQLLGKLEDRTYKVKNDDLQLSDVLVSLSHGLEHPREMQWHVRCPAELRVRTDGPVLESILVNLLSVCTEAGMGERKACIRGDLREEAPVISIFAPLELPFLHSPDRSGSEVSRLVGGIPGLMLCLANSMAHFLGGAVTLRESTVTDRAALPPEMSGLDGMKLYHMMLVLPR